jgi:hypothetical protein
VIGAGSYKDSIVIHTAAEQTDRTSKAKFLAAALRTALCDLEAVSDEKIFGQVLGIF